jgi:predicted amidohydrolase
MYKGNYMSFEDDLERKLIFRNASMDDVVKISELMKQIFFEFDNHDLEDHDLNCVRKRIEHYPEGQFVAVYDDKIVGYSGSTLLSGEIALRNHSWAEVTDLVNNGEVRGDYLYGLETCVDQGYWNHHIGHRFYNERKSLCIKLNLKGIVMGGRLLRFNDYKIQVKTPEKYIELVQKEEIDDRTLSFQLHNGFMIKGVLTNYAPDDGLSSGYASHLIWYNPELEVTDSHPAKKLKKSKRTFAQSDSDHIRVAVVQYKQRAVQSFAEFSAHVEYFIRSVAEYRADFVLFPESFTMQLLSINGRNSEPMEAILELTNYVDDYKTMMQSFAKDYHVNIIGGSIATLQEDKSVQNISYVFLRNGLIYSQSKIHPTPDERIVWGMKGGNVVQKIMTDCGPVGVLICYDSEFPELPRYLVDQGIYILFIPFCTDSRTGYLRVRYCAQARAVENQCYVAIAGNVGNLPGVKNMNLQYAESCIFTPCDFPFARDGIAAETTSNVEMMAFADLNIKSLIAARKNGSVTNLRDRRTDLYSIVWHKS